MKISFMKISLLVFAVGFFGCASKKDLTAVETVEGLKASVDTTDQFIQKANTQLKDFEKTLADLRKDANGSTRMRGKAKFNEALANVGPSLDHASAELRQLSVANRASWDNFKGKLENADEHMRQSFSNMLDENGKAE